jgi:hypothetical protein
MEQSHDQLGKKKKIKLKPRIASTALILTIYVIEVVTILIE